MSFRLAVVQYPSRYREDFSPSYSSEGDPCCDDRCRHYVKRGRKCKLTKLRIERYCLPALLDRVTELRIRRERVARGRTNVARHKLEALEAAKGALVARFGGRTDHVSVLEKLVKKQQARVKTLEERERYVR